MKKKYESHSEGSVTVLACASLLSFAVSLQHALLYLIFRTGLENSYTSIGILLLVAGAICCSPHLLPARLQSNPAYVALSILGALLCAGIAYLSIAACMVIYAALFVCGTLKMLHNARYLNRWDVVCILLFALVISVYTFLKSNEFRHLPYGIFMQELSMFAFLSRDAYLHAAIIKMLDNYGVPSLGIGRLDTVNYHFGFHLLTAGLMKLSGLPVMSIIPLVLRMVIFPLFCLSFAISLMKFIKDKQQFYLAFFVLIVLLFLTESVGTSVNWLSESYTLSIPFLFLGLACVFGFIPILSVAQSPFVSFLTFAVTVLLALVSKVSVGLVIVGFVGYLSLRHYGLRLQTLCLGMLLVLSLWLAKQYLTMDHITGYDAFYLLETRSISEHIAPLLPLLVILLFRRLDGTPSVGILPRKLYEALGVVVAITYSVPNILAIHSGSGLYILDISRWIIIWVVMLLLFSPSKARMTSSVQETSSLAEQLVYLALEKRRWILLVGLLGVLMLSQSMSLFKVTYKLYDHSKAAAELEIERGYVTGAFHASGAGSLLGDKVSYVEKYGYGQYLLKKLAESIKPSDLKGETAIYVPYDNFFWRWPEVCNGTKIGRRTEQQIFFFQAMAGIPVLNDWPYSKNSCAYNDFLSVGEYSEEERPQGDESNNWICLDAGKKEFSEILVLRGDLFNLRFERLICKK